jgi:hypothetical protein
MSAGADLPTRSRRNARSPGPCRDDRSIIPALGAQRVQVAAIAAAGRRRRTRAERTAAEATQAQAAVCHHSDGADAPAGVDDGDRADTGGTSTAMRRPGHTEPHGRRRNQMAKAPSVTVAGRSVADRDGVGSVAAR